MGGRAGELPPSLALPGELTGCKGAFVGCSKWEVPGRVLEGQVLVSHREWMSTRSGAGC